MVLGNLVIYAFGVPWLAAALDVDLRTALEVGAWPFLIGDALKIALAAGLLPPPGGWWGVAARLIAVARRRPADAPLSGAN